MNEDLRIKIEEVRWGCDTETADPFMLHQS